MKKITRPGGIIILFLSLFFLFAGNVFAIEYGMLGGKPVNSDPSVENSEAWFIYGIKPGESKEDAIEVMNLFENEFDVLVYAADTVKSSSGGFALKQFSEKNEGVGNWVRFYSKEVPEDFKAFFEKKEKKIVEFCRSSREDIDEEFGKVGVSDEQFSTFKKWCEGESSVEKNFKSKDRIVIPFVISVPENTDVGEHTGGILIQKKGVDDVSQAGGSSVKLTTRVGVRIYQTVPGEVVRKITIDGFRAVKNFREFDFSDWFGKEKKIKEFLLETNISNSGNVSIEHQNNIYVEDMLFGKRDEQIKRTFQIIRGDKFIANYSWAKPFFGYYSFQPEIIYQNGEKEEVIKGDVLKMWVIPWRELAIFAIVAVFVAVGIYFWKRRQKKLYGGIGWVEYAADEADTVAKLAEKYGIDWMVFAKTNKLKPPYHLYSGQSLLVPFVDVEDDAENDAENDAETPKEEDVIVESKPVKSVSEKKSKQEAKKILKIKKEETIIESKPVESIIEKKQPEKTELTEVKKTLFNKCNKEKCLEIAAIVAIVIGLTFLVVAGIVSYGKAKKETSLNGEISISTIAEEVKEDTENRAVEDPVENNVVEDDADEAIDVIENAEHSKEEIKVVVLNGGDIPGSAGKMKEFLLEKGYVSVESENAQKDDYAGKVVYYAEGFEKDAKALAEIIDAEKEAMIIDDSVIENKEDVDVIVVLGK